MTFRSNVFAALLVLTASSAFAVYDTYDTCTAGQGGCPDISRDDPPGLGRNSDDRRDVEHRGDQRLPAGSYQLTCRQISVDAANLYAQCRRKDGSWNGAVLKQYKTCRPGIDNIDGNLRCDHNVVGSPPGSYARTCRNELVSQGRLVAECRSRDGHYRKTELDVGGCKGDISNQDGVLACPR